LLKVKEIHLSAFPTMSIWCLIVNDAYDVCEPVGVSFKVNVSQSNNIDDLKEVILAEQKALALEDAASLFVWKPKVTIAVDRSIHLVEVRTLQLNRETGKEDNDKAMILAPSDKITDVLSDTKYKKRVHLLVQLPPSEERRSKRRRVDDGQCHLSCLSNTYSSSSPPFLPLSHTLFDFPTLMCR
jgi:hypothetical protein